MPRRRSLLGGVASVVAGLFALPGDAEATDIDSGTGSDDVTITDIDIDLPVADFDLVHRDRPEVDEWVLQGHVTATITVNGHARAYQQQGEVMVKTDDGEWRLEAGIDGDSWQIDG